MQVVQVPYCFHPDPVGGTELYVVELARELARRGDGAVIAAPGAVAATYDWEGIPVHRFACSIEPVELRDLYGDGDRVAAREFGRLLNHVQPDLVHLHANSPGVSLRLLREIKTRNVPVVFTYHTPAVTCARGSLMRWGSTPCEGMMHIRDCARCTLHSLGLSRLSAELVGSIPVGFGAKLAGIHATGRTLTALRMTELMNVRHQARRAFFDEVDLVVTVCEWARQLLVRNGVSAAKIAVCRHGVAAAPATGLVNSQRPEREHARPTLRLAFLGRLDPVKGLSVLFRALRLAPDLVVELDIFGVSQGEGGAQYARKLHQQARSDERISFRGTISSADVVPTLRGYDALVVPSQCLETGPLVVLEAFAAGIPVIGSRLGGIVELITDGKNGLLVEATNIDAWMCTLRRLSGNRDLLCRLRQGVRPPRSVTDVADEMLALYARCVPSGALDRDR